MIPLGQTKSDNINQWTNPIVARLFLQQTDIEAHAQ